MVQTEKEKYKAWLKEGYENKGLINHHITVGASTTNVSEEEFYRELNHWNEQADDVENKARIEIRFL